MTSSLEITMSPTTKSRSRMRRRSWPGPAPGVPSATPPRFPPQFPYRLWCHRDPRPDWPRHSREQEDGHAPAQQAAVQPGRLVERQLLVGDDRGSASPNRYSTLPSPSWRKAMCSSLPSARNNSGSTSTQRCSAQGPSPP